MHAKYKWLLLPPAIALLLFLGPLRDQGTAASSSPGSATTIEQPGSGIPDAPSIGQVASTVGGVLLLGAVVIILLARFRGRQNGGAEGPLSIRQSTRLSTRHTVHVVQFDDRLLLLGECEGQLTVLSGSEAATELADDRHIAARADDEGAVPRDLVIPRQQKRLPKRPRQRAEDPTTPTAATANFKSLLELARSGTQK